MVGSEALITTSNFKEDMKRIEKYLDDNDTLFKEDEGESMFQIQDCLRF